MLREADHDWHEQQHGTWGHSGQPAVMRPRARRLAQGVLSREDPEESFLKGVPTEPDSLELVFPVPAPARRAPGTSALPCPGDSAGAAKLGARMAGKAASSGGSAAQSPRLGAHSRLLL